jgi:DNA-binding SARP family transcriptional activator
MLERREGLAQLLHDAIAAAEATPMHGDVLVHLRSAWTSLRPRVPGFGVRVDALTGAAFSGDRRIALSPSETACVIALALSGSSALRELLAERLYPDADPANAANALKVVVHRVRRRMDRADVIRYVCGRYSLAPWVHVDLPLEMPACRYEARQPLPHAERVRLESLRERLAAGRPEFALCWEWFDDTERRLRDLEREVSIALARDALWSGRYTTAIELAHELLRDDPLEESAADVILRSFVEGGDRMQAAAFYRRYDALVMRETGSPPSDELRRIVTARPAAPSAAR